MQNLKIPLKMNKQGTKRGHGWDDLEERISEKIFLKNVAPEEANPRAGKATEEVPNRRKNEANASLVERLQDAWEKKG